MPLVSRELGDLLAEEVRRLDADEVFAEALVGVDRRQRPRRRSPKREHIWHDPARSGDRRKPDVAARNQLQATGQPHRASPSGPTKSAEPEGRSTKE